MRLALKARQPFSKELWRQLQSLTPAFTSFPSKVAHASSGVEEGCARWAVGLLIN